MSEVGERGRGRECPGLGLAGRRGQGAFAHTWPFRSAGRSLESGHPFIALSLMQKSKDFASIRWGYRLIGSRAFADILVLCHHSRPAGG